MRSTGEAYKARTKYANMAGGRAQERKKEMWRQGNRIRSTEEKNVK